MIGVNAKRVVALVRADFMSTKLSIVHYFVNNAMRKLRLAFKPDSPIRARVLVIYNCAGPNPTAGFVIKISF